MGVFNEDAKISANFGQPIREGRRSDITQEEFHVNGPYTKFRV